MSVPVGKLTVLLLLAIGHGVLLSTFLVQECGGNDGRVAIQATLFAMAIVVETLAARAWIDRSLKR